VRIVGMHGGLVPMRGARGDQHDEEHGRAHELQLIPARRRAPDFDRRWSHAPCVLTSHDARLV
jgi:hypothetical protein